jgi:hypothetical protein
MEQVSPRGGPTPRTGHTERFPPLPWSQTCSIIRLTRGPTVASTQQDRDVFEAHRRLDDFISVGQDESASRFRAHSESSKRLRLIPGDPRRGSSALKSKKSEELDSSDLNRLVFPAQCTCTCTWAVQDSNLWPLARHAYLVSSAPLSTGRYRPLTSTYCSGQFGAIHRNLSALLHRCLHFQTRICGRGRAAQADSGGAAASPRHGHRPQSDGRLPPSLVHLNLRSANRPWTRRSMSSTIGRTTSIG